MSQHEDVPEMIRDCVERESKLTDWEQGFIQSIGEQHDRTGSLTQGQYETLEKIWNRIT